MFGGNIKMMEVLAIIGALAIVIWIARAIMSAANRGESYGKPETRAEVIGRDRSREDGSYGGWDRTYSRPVTDGPRFWIEYSDINGEITEREITPLGLQMKAGRQAIVIRALCHLRNEERSFRSDRILAARNIDTGRPIRDLGQYLRGRY